MATFARSSRAALRLLSSKPANVVSRRGYADEMDFTLAAANKGDDSEFEIKTRLGTTGIPYYFALADPDTSLQTVFYANANVRQVDVPSFSGAFGILPKHVPTLAVLKPGVVTVYEKDGTAKKVFVSSGTITINDDSSVQVLAEEAHPVEDLDAAAAREQLSKAQSDASRASSEIEKAEALIAVEVAEALVAAAQ